MELGTIFYEKDYTDAYNYAIKNDLTITEISADEVGKRFQIVRIPEPTKEDVLQGLRTQREYECFSVINRGQLWYDTLTDERIADLDEWYHAWLDVTETKVIPEKPIWLSL